MNDTQLASELQGLGILFVRAGTSSLSGDPVQLIADLAASEEARMRLALILLFIRYPDYSAYVNKAVQLLDPSPRITLICYYTAAALLQKKYAEQLKYYLGELIPLPDCFSSELTLPSNGDAASNLKILAGRQALLSGEEINWLGTYEHAFERWWEQCKRKAEWKN